MTARPATTHRAQFVLGVAVVGMAVLAAGWLIYRQRHSFQMGLREIGLQRVLLSVSFAIAGIGCTFGSWVVVLRGLGVRIGTAEAGRVFFVSQLGKYLPGSVWPVALQMQAGRRHGARPRTMLAANLFTLALGCTVGLVLGGIALAAAGSSALGRYWWVALALLALLPMLHPRAMPAVLDRLFALLGREPLDERLPLRTTVISAMWSVASWLCFGVHLLWLCSAFVHVDVALVARCVAAAALAVTLGVLFIPAPAGAGVRDVAIGIIVGPALAHGSMLTVVVLARSIVVVGDLTVALMAAISTRREVPG